MLTEPTLGVILAPNKGGAGIYIYMYVYVARFHPTDHFGV